MIAWKIFKMPDLKRFVPEFETKGEMLRVPANLVFGAGKTADDALKTISNRIKNQQDMVEKAVKERDGEYDHWLFLEPINVLAEPDGTGYYSFCRVAVCAVETGDVFSGFAEVNDLHELDKCENKSCENCKGCKE